MKMLTSLLVGSVVVLNAGDYKFEAVEANAKKRNLLPDMSKFVSKKISRKSASDNVVNKCTDITTVFASDKTIILTSNSFGPLPVTFKLVDDQGNHILEETNKDNVTSKFKIPVKQLTTGATLQVFNAFDESIFCHTIKLIDPDHLK